jgi:hypothetical protein
MSRFVSILALAIVVPAALACHTEPIGTGAPGPLIGPYARMAYPADPTPVFGDVTSVSDGMGGGISFSQGMSHRRIGSGWGSWSHGYTGDVYYTNGTAAVNMTLTTPQPGFQFFIEPNPFGVWNMTVTTTGSKGEVQSATAGVEGLSGAAGFNCFCDPGSLVTSVSIQGATDFAVGEFAKGVPEPSTLGLLSLGLIGLLRRR